MSLQNTPHQTPRGLVHTSQTEQKVTSWHHKTKQNKSLFLFSHFQQDWHFSKTSIKNNYFPNAMQIWWFSLRDEEKKRWPTERSAQMDSLRQDETRKGNKVMSRYDTKKQQHWMTPTHEWWLVIWVKSFMEVQGRGLYIRGHTGVGGSLQLALFSYLILGLERGTRVQENKKKIKGVKSKAFWRHWSRDAAGFPFSPQYDIDVTLLHGCASRLGTSVCVCALAKRPSQNANHAKPMS